MGMPASGSGEGNRRSGLERASLGVNRVVEGVVAVLGMGMALVVGLQVVCRYGLNHSLFWSEELARYLLVGLSLLGAGIAYRRGVHPGVDSLTRRLPAGAAKAAAAVAHLSALFLFGVMVVFGLAFAWFVRQQISPALGLPKWIVFGIVPVSGAILGLHAAAFLTRVFRGERP